MCGRKLMRSPQLHTGVEALWCGYAAIKQKEGRWSVRRKRYYFREMIEKNNLVKALLTGIDSSFLRGFFCIKVNQEGLILDSKSSVKRFKNYKYERPLKTICITDCLPQDAKRGLTKANGETALKHDSLDR